MGQWASKDNANGSAREEDWFLVPETEACRNERLSPVPVAMTEMRMDDTYDGLPSELRPLPTEEDWRLMPDDLGRLEPVRMGLYGGLWYSVLNTSSWFQPECLRNVTTEYQLDDRHDELRLLNKATCCGCCIVQARGVAVPVPGHQDRGAMHLEDGPRNFHAHFCVNRAYEDNCCGRLCCQAGSYQILRVGYLSQDGQAILSEPTARQPLRMEYTPNGNDEDPPYDFAVVGNCTRDKAWLLMRRPMNKLSPFHDRHTLLNILRPFGYADDIMVDLHYVWHTDTEAYKGERYLKCTCC